MSKIRASLESLLLGPALADSKINSRRAQVRSAIFDVSTNIGHGNFDRISSADLKSLLDSYDQLFFSNLCQQLIDENQDTLSFRVSTRMTSTGGKTTIESIEKSRSAKDFPRRKFEIAISAVLLFGSFAKDHSRRTRSRRHSFQQHVRVAGVHCRDRLDALQRIFEHELLHLIEFLVWNNSSCSAKRFRSIAWRIFGHEQSNHQLITPSETAELHQGIGIGDFVCFRHDGHQLFGYVNQINRRATVLVPDRNGAKYTDGKKYAKYYVPISQLSRSKKK